MVARAVAYPKAMTVAAVCQALTEPDGNCQHIVADVLAPGDQAEAVDAALKSAQAIVDFSASMTWRECSRGITGPPAAVSPCSLNPRNRPHRARGGCRTRGSLDALEMQYYRALSTRRLWRTHSRLRRTECGTVARAATLGCSSPGPCSRSCRNRGKSAGKGIGAARCRVLVWRADPATFAVNAIEVPVMPGAHLAGDWTLVIDTALMTEWQRCGVQAAQ